VVNGSEAILRDLAAAFGPDVIAADGTLNRRIMASRAFATPDGIDRLNRIVHPELIFRIRARIREQRRNCEPTAVDCALIYEWGIEHDFDLVVCVQAETGLRIDRLFRRDGRSRDEIEGLMASQLPQDEKVRRADLVLTNNGTIEQLETLAGLIALLPNVTSGRITNG
jgi:dephospho-CoA kinase